MKKESKASPMRTCVACNGTFPKQELVKLVLSPDKTVEIDYLSKLKGRGAYLCPNEKCFLKAEKKSSFQRSFREKKYSYEAQRLWSILQKANRDRLKESIRLAKKAGHIISGATKVEQALKTEKAFLLIISEDASENTVDRFERLAISHDTPVIKVLGMEELGPLLGKDQRATLAITAPDFLRRLESDGRIYEKISTKSI